jgi:phospholipid/cholesterol/gamma-HCH transport system ATP-binding protein
LRETVEETDYAIELNGVRKKFGDGPEVLKGVDLKIPKGKITVLIGFSGAGKSVLLKHILGLLRADEGTITVFGQDILKMNEQELNEIRKKFGMLFQSAALFDDMTTIENVSFPIKEFRRKLSSNEVSKIAAQKLQVVGLEPEHFNKFPSELSGGMRKRVGLARAIALEPEIILYDEPTTGLDPILTEMVDDLIFQTHAHQEGLTTVIISHDLPAAFRLGDYIAMLDEGQIRLFGPPQVFTESQDPFIKKFVEKVKEFKKQ